MAAPQKASGRSKVWRKPWVAPERKPIGWGIGTPFLRYRGRIYSRDDLLAMAAPLGLLNTEGELAVNPVVVVKRHYLEGGALEGAPLSR